MIFRREAGYLDNPVCQNLWRAGHAHAGVLVILTLVGLLLVDQADLSNGLRWLVRYALVAGPILMPLGFFLSVASREPRTRTASSTWSRSGACRSASVP